MDRFTSRAKFLAVVLLLSATQVLAADKLVVNGKTASTDVRTVNGATYVKLSDIAKAFGMIVVKRPGGGYELTKAGGANQVEGMTQGKIGDVLFDGKWRFQVQSIQSPESYTMKVPAVEPSSHPRDIIDFDTKNRVLRAKPGYKLVIIQARMTNGQKTSQTFWLAQPTNNALADTNGESYTPVGYDLEGAPIQSKRLLPGAKTDFAILFSVPESTQAKDLVFTLHNNNSSETPNDVRVSLTP